MRYTLITQVLKQSEFVFGAIGTVFMILMLALVVVEIARPPEQVVHQSDAQLRAEVDRGSRWSLAIRSADDSDEARGTPPMPKATLNGATVEFEAEDRDLSNPSETDRWRSFASLEAPESGTLVVHAAGLPESVTLRESEHPLFKAIFPLGVLFWLMGSASFAIAAAKMTMRTIRGMRKSAE